MAVPCLALPGDVLLDSSLFRPLSLVRPLLTKKAPTAQRYRRPSLPHPACLALAAPHSSSSFFSSSFSSSSPNQDSQLDKRSAPTPRHVRLPPGRLSLLVPSLLGRGKPAQPSVPQCRARRRTSHIVSVPVQSRRARTSAPAREIQPRAHPLAHSPAQVPATPVSPSSPRAPSPQPSPAHQASTESGSPSRLVWLSDCGISHSRVFRIHSPGPLPDNHQPLSHQSALLFGIALHHHGGHVRLAPLIRPPVSTSGIP